MTAVVPLLFTSVICMILCLPFKFI